MQPTFIVLDFVTFTILFWMKQQFIHHNSHYVRHSIALLKHCKNVISRTEIILKPYLEQCLSITTRALQPWPHVTNRHISISQLLSL